MTAKSDKQLETEESLLGLINKMKEIDYIDPEIIPDIELYMDQVTTFMDLHLGACRRTSEEKVLTKTMINNYTKNDVLPPPIKKKYSKDLICTLFTGQTSKEGIFMRYSYEFKRKCVEMYYRGEYPDTPDGIRSRSFHDKIREWVRIEESCGPEALRNKCQYKEWTPEERYALVARVLAGESCRSVAVSAGIASGQLYQWVHKYKIYGYNGLIPKQKGRKSRNPDMKKVGTRKPPKPDESEYEELIRLRAENEYMKAEIEVIKKEIALREEKEAARLKAKKQRSSRNSVPKDSN